ncbi:hypothetical protein AAVH_14025 [Aphelenchoides avenae]|nr:hypothetical protein AAVH_14025 [Aphelenchus avenae]
MTSCIVLSSYDKTGDMAKITLALFALALISVVASIGSELDTTNSTITARVSRAMRFKRGPICWDDMVRQCCGRRKRCSGAGCRYLMCSICC